MRMSIPCADDDDDDDDDSDNSGNNSYQVDVIT